MQVLALFLEVALVVLCAKLCATTIAILRECEDVLATIQGLQAWRECGCECHCHEGTE